MSARRLPLGLVLLIVAAGVGLRAFILTHALGVLDADEATTGLVARHFLHNGEYPAFYWASNYGGTLEAAVTAAVFAVTGSSVLVLKLVSVAWHAAACVLTWRVGRRLFNERVGQVAGLLLWVWPGTYVWWSTKSRGFYGALLVLGLVTVLTALRVAERPTRYPDWLALGLAVGLGWWTGPQIAAIAVPAATWLLARNWRAVVYGWAAVPGAIIGMAPWLVWNVEHRLASLDVPPQPVTAPFLTRLARFWTEGLPMATGLRVPYTLEWVESWAVWAFIAGALGVGGLLLVRHRRPGLLVLLGVAEFGLLYAANPLTVHSVDGRYLFILAPVICLGVAAAATWRPPVEAVVLMAAVVLAALGLSTMKHGNSFAASDRVVPVELSPLVEVLEDEAVRTVVSDYAIAYRINFETDERIIAAGAPYNRYEPYVEAVVTGPPPAWVFVSGSAADREFHAELDRSGIRYRVRQAGGFTVYLPEKRIRPGEAPTAAALVPE